ncbi:MAG: AmmeMemoRadiSam system protein B [Chloroflexi bacterium]|nr:AmmeMemoRadiSam system protein B [Chloroflexota bacterium]
MPPHPKLRPIDVKRIVDNGQPYFVLRDPLGISSQMAVMPEAIGPLLAKCDGTRDTSALAAAFHLETGYPMTAAQAGQIIEGLSQGLLLDDERFKQALEEARRDYLSRPFRQPALTDKVYPADPGELEATMRRYIQEAGGRPGTAASRFVGVISPHIDYHRGWKTYAQVWSQAAPAIAEAELVVIFGTDHAGSAGRLTLTRQSYATPWGILPTSQAIVNELAEAIGQERAFAEELHHKNEHSIELAAIWLHYFMRPRRCEVVPILCGSFHEFIAGMDDPQSYEPFQQAMAVLQRAAAGKRTVVVAAADLAHVGPNFGDAYPWSPPLRAGLKATDASLMNAVTQGDHAGFFQRVKQDFDQHKVCGLPPIYLTLRMLDGATGHSMGYDQCPADEQRASLVSIAGAVIAKEAS